MPTITIFRIEGKLGSLEEIVKRIDKKSFKESWFVAKKSKFNKNEIFIQYFYYQKLEEVLRKVLGSEYAEDVIGLLKVNGKVRVLKRVYCYINTLTKTLEVYRGPDKITREIAEKLEKLLGIRLKRLKIKPEQLKQIYSNYSIELRQAFFENINGLQMQVLKSRNLERNKLFELCIKKFLQSLKAITFRPRIKSLNHNSKYYITINGDRGTIKFFPNGKFKWRPRFEIRQILFAVANVIGLLR